MASYSQLLLPSWASQARTSGGAPESIANSVQERPGGCGVTVAGSLLIPLTAQHRLFRGSAKEFEQEGCELNKETAGCRKKR